MTDDVMAAAQAAFNDAEFAEVIAALDRYGVESYEHERERVQLAIIELCGGSKDKLLELVQMAKTDYRDILAWKQLGPIPKAEGERLQNEARRLMEKWGKR